MTDKTTVYLPGINALRFFAALAVMITHVELIKSSFKIKNYWNNEFIFNLGGLGVCFFFVLSGFLITYLLLEEKKQFQKINIKEFYLRRILRIWPLYYLIVIIGFFILPHFTQIQIPYLQSNATHYFSNNLFLYVLILPNVAFALYSAFPHIGQAWSIGVEEQFYIIWPFIISRLNNLIKGLITIFLAIIAIKILILVLGIYSTDQSWYKPLKNLIAMSKFESMALGGIGACFLHQQQTKVLRYIYNRIIFNISIIIIPLLIHFTPNFLQDGIHILYSVAFTIIIIHVISSKKLLINLENKVLNHLGKISYGLYMYHLMIIPITIYLLSFLNLNESLFNITLYTVVILITILVSSCSYYFFENYFIRLKYKYSPIKSQISPREINKSST